MPESDDWYGRIRKGTRMLKALVVLGLMTSTLGVASCQQAGQTAYSASGNVKGCRVVRQPIGRHVRRVCLLVDRKGHSSRVGLWPMRVHFSHMTVGWWYQCPRGVPYPTFELSFTEDLGPNRLAPEGFGMYGVTFVKNRRFGHGRVRYALAPRGHHEIGFTWEAGSFDPRNGSVRKPRYACSWHVTVTGDNDPTPADRLAA